jgi:hypothetical protein
MDDFNQLFALLKDDDAAQQCPGVCARLSALFSKLPAEATTALFESDHCVPALLHVIQREEKGDNGILDTGTRVDVAAAWTGALNALNILLPGLSCSVKQSLLSGDKGIVRCLLLVLGDFKGQAAWDIACQCFSNIFTGTSTHCREALVSDGRCIVDTIVGVLEGDEAAAWASAGTALNIFLSEISVSTKQLLLSGENGVVVRIIGVLNDGSQRCGAFSSASSFMSNIIAGVPLSAKSLFLVSQPQLVGILISLLETEDAHTCWEGAMTLLKRLVYQETSLVHINFCTLDFLKKDCGLIAVLLRCSHEFIDADNARFHSLSLAFRQLTLKTSNPPFIAISLNILERFIDAARLCSVEATLVGALLVLSNFSHDIAYCSVLAQAKCHELAFSHIVGVSSTHESWNNGNSVATRSISLIVNMSRNEALHAELKRCHVIDILTPLSDPTCAAQVRVLMVMSYIIGFKESIGKNDAISSAFTVLTSSTSIGKLIECLENTLNLKGGHGYTFGSLPLSSILQVRNIVFDWHSCMLNIDLF